MRKRKSKASSVQAGVMTLRYSGTVKDDLDCADLALLEKERDLAATRFSYALEQQVHWNSEVQFRMMASLAAQQRYLEKKHGFTADQLSADHRQTTSVWTYETPTKATGGTK